MKKKKKKMKNTYFLSYSNDTTKGQFTYKNIILMVNCKRKLDA